MIDDALDLNDGDTLRADVCIVGAGAAGIAIAHELADSGVDVLLLESGGMKPDAQTSDLYRGVTADEHLHCEPHRYRERRFGGTTTIWGGRCIPLDPIDFEARDYLPLSGWPIGADALAPYYPRANELCEAGEFKYRAEDAFPHPLRPMIAGFSSTHFTTNTLERFSCPTDFGARYGARLRGSRNVRVLLHANLTDVQLSASGQTVESLVVRTLTKKRFTVKAARVVLATGGIEVTRLLLANRDVWPDGIGNAHDVVGRYYMCHLSGTIGTFTPSGSRESIQHGYDISPDGVYCRRRLALTAETQRKLGIGNVIGRLHHPPITDPSHRTAALSALYLGKGFISYEYRKRLVDPEEGWLRTWMGHVRNVLSAPHEAFAFGQFMLRKHILAKRKFPSIIVTSTAGHYTFEFHSEQQPTATSRISLTNERDALGMPRVKIDWHYSAWDLETVRQAVRLFGEDVRASGVGRFEYDPVAVEPALTQYGAYGGHHIGTTRMGDDPRTSVVDANCRVHGISNLYIASCSVFPTSSQANPTLTLVALAIRLAAHLRSAAAAEGPVAIAMPRTATAATSIATAGAGRQMHA